MTITDVFSHAALDLLNPCWAPDSRRLAFRPEGGVAVGVLGDPEGWFGLGPGAWPSWHPGR